MGTPPIRTPPIRTPSFRKPALAALAALTLATLALAACAMTTGIVPAGPGTWLVSEMRAPVLGGAAQAQRVAIAEAQDFCARQGAVFTPLAMAPGGYPYSVYGPTNFTTTFRCDPPPHTALPRVLPPATSSAS